MRRDNSTIRDTGRDDTQLRVECIPESITAFESALDELETMYVSLSPQRMKAREPHVKSEYLRTYNESLELILRELIFLRSQIACTDMSAALCERTDLFIRKVRDEQEALVMKMYARRGAHILVSGNTVGSRVAVSERDDDGRVLSRRELITQELALLKERSWHLMEEMDRTIRAAWDPLSQNAALARELDRIGKRMDEIEHELQTGAPPRHTALILRGVVKAALRAIGI